MNKRFGSRLSWNCLRVLLIARVATLGRTTSCPDVEPAAETNMRDAAGGLELVVRSEHVHRDKQAPTGLLGTL